MRPTSGRLELRVIDPRSPADSPSPFADVSLLARYRKVRAESEARAAPLSAEDMQAQSMPDASPVKWHLAHTTWFWETFVLVPHAGMERFDPDFTFLFNSYYEAVGARPARETRGLITRPGVERVCAYRAHVDAGMTRLLAQPLSPHVQALVRLGLAHEEQHQELLLTDALHLLAQNPLRPVYAPERPVQAPSTGPFRWIEHDGGLIVVGRVEGDAGYGFDNEAPTHRVWLEPFRMAARLTTNGEWLAFMQAGGYRTATLWLADGWDVAKREAWDAPLYWTRGGDGTWRAFGLNGLHPVDPDAPVRHVSFYEADAYARWCGMRLPTETEWETARRADALCDADGAVWQWTASAYLPYPGYEAAPGAVGEYNGKFMSGQMVLRGGSAFTPTGHAGPAYRNFFPPDRRWQLCGLRLCADGRASDDPRSFRDDVLEGLSRTPKATPPKWLYDDEGSRLFEAITDTPEYYPTRIEAALLEQTAAQIAAHIPDGAALVEFGSGSSTKTRLLLSAAPQLAAYAPIDISLDALGPAAAAIAAAYPLLEVLPIEADFTRPGELPEAVSDRSRVGFFPGSTIGNFDPDGAKGFLRKARDLLGAGALFIVGLDLAKSPELLEAAYDDAAGVTAAFNLNLLTRINRELEGDFDPAAFRHRARWNAGAKRVEMHLESLREQVVTVAGRPHHFALAETLHTESSYKTTVEQFEALAAEAGWSTTAHWRSPQPLAFAVVLLRAPL